jgi:membrane-associated phospholipid phosphatase
MAKMSIKLAGLTTALIAPVLLASPAFAGQVFNAAQTAVFNQQTASTPSRTPRNALDRLLLWNEIMLDANAVDHTGMLPNGTSPNPMAGDQQGPTRNSRAFAIVSLAVYDAVNAFEREFQPYNRSVGRAREGTSKNAAIAAAAYTSLSRLYPKQGARLLAIYNADLAAINASPSAKAAGVALGVKSADAMVTRRGIDGSEIGEVAFGTLNASVSGGTTNVRGNPINANIRTAPNWSPDPVGLPRGVALGANWGAVKPFVLRTGRQFRIPNYPAPGSARNIAAFNDVATNGIITNSPTNQFIGNFWGYDGAPILGTPPRLYNQVAKVVANREELRDVGEYARLLAIVNTTMGDSGIAAWDSKYFHNYWRPVTGVRGGGPGTPGIAGWKPFGASVVNMAVSEAFTPPFPAYPSGHATFGAALFQTLTSYFGNNTRFTFVSDEYDGISVDPKGDPRPLVPVRYRSLLEAQKENGRSRVFNGVHWEPDDTEGQNLGTNITRYTLATQFRRLHDDDDDE